ncbi:MAG TPA: SH3 domain-containing protein [Chloroflexi bacterium]|nr:SH3 domain-containing protein [Chloroflexota bacterium]
MLPTTHWLVWIGVLLMVAGCGPARAADTEATLRNEIARIAQEFNADQDVARARAALEELDVANPRQYLMLQTEEMIAANSDPALTASLVKLTDALNIQSTVIRTYAAQQGLAPPTPTFALEAIAVAPTLPSVATPAPTALPSAAADVASAASLTTPAAVALLDLPTPTAQNSAPAAPQGKATGLINVRSGPGTEFAAVATLAADETVELTGKTPAGDWWQVKAADGATGWVFGQLLETTGDVAAVAVAADIPTPPPASALVADAAPATPPAAEPTAAPAGEPTAAPAPAGSPSDQPYFKLVASRMWSKAENGDCRGQHLLRINVIDANGVRINGVRLKGIYTGEILVTGSQGKGDGVIEYDLYGTGEGFVVIQNDDGREAASDRAEGFTTQSRDISQDVLIAGGYCSNASDCQVFYDSWGCNGHHSWEATFQRNY